MTTPDLLARVWSALDDDSADHQRYPFTTMLAYLADGVYLYMARVRSMHTYETLTQTPGVALYALPADCVSVTRVEWVSGGTFYPVSPTTMRELDEQWGRRVGWEQDVGTRAQWYYIFGVNQIGLYPKIGSGTEQYRVHYSRVETAALPLSLVPEEDHEGLINYVVARCLAADKKAKEAFGEYAQFTKMLKGAKARRQSADRQSSMAAVPGWQGIGAQGPL